MLGLLTKAPTFLVNALSDSTGSEGETLLRPSSLRLSPLCDKPSSSPLRGEGQDRKFKFQNDLTELRTNTGVQGIKIGYSFHWLMQSQRTITCCSVCWGHALLSDEHLLHEEASTEPRLPSQHAKPREEAMAGLWEDINKNLDGHCLVI